MFSQVASWVNLENLFENKPYFTQNDIKAMINSGHVKDGKFWIICERRNIYPPYECEYNDYSQWNNAQLLNKVKIEKKYNFSTKTYDYISEYKDDDYPVITMLANPENADMLISWYYKKYIMFITGLGFRVETENGDIVSLDNYLNPTVSTEVLPDDSTDVVPEEPIVIPDEPVNVLPDDSTDVIPEEPIIINDEPITVLPDDLTDVVPEEPTVINDEPITVLPEKPTDVIPEEPTVINDQPITVLPEEPVDVLPPEKIIPEENPNVIAVPSNKNDLSRKEINAKLKSLIAKKKLADLIHKKNNSKNSTNNVNNTNNTNNNTDNTTSPKSTKPLTRDERENLYTKKRLNELNEFLINEEEVTGV